MKTKTRAPKKNASSAYAQAGVDIDAKMHVISKVKAMVNRTSTRGVMGGIGGFGGLFASPGKESMLVASTDGVGTKVKVATLAGRHDTVGQDIVNHCINDILVQGAQPLFLMDYIGTSKVIPEVLHQVISGLCKACHENKCALLGGETAEMPGIYPPGEYDLAATIVGVVTRRDLVTGRSIRPGDVVIGLPSSGLHTNGYSLARKVIFETAKLKPSSRLPGTRQTVADALLAVHRSYLKPVLQLRKKVRIQGMAHITGGGFPDNIPRVLPDNARAVIDRSTWEVPALFQFIQERGNVDREEMYRVFNMGIGYILIVRPAEAEKALQTLRAARCPGKRIGFIERAPKGVRLIG